MCRGETSPDVFISRSIAFGACMDLYAARWSGFRSYEGGVRNRRRNSIERFVYMLLERTTIPDVSLANNNQQHERDATSCIRVLVLVINLRYFKYNLSVYNNSPATPLRFHRIVSSHSSCDVQKYLGNSNQREQDRFCDRVDYRLRPTLGKSEILLKRNSSFIFAIVAGSHHSMLTSAAPRKFVEKTISKVSPRNPIIRSTARRQRS